MTSVRLTHEEIDGIKTAALEVFGANLMHIRLYGSRTDATKAGGDIDLVFALQCKPVDKFSQTQKLRQELCARLGEQKFDLCILSQDATENSDRENNFFSMIMPSSKVIWTAHE